MEGFLLTMIFVLPILLLLFVGLAFLFGLLKEEYSRLSHQ
jgi:L-asparagine transporter-like permease